MDISLLPEQWQLLLQQYPQLMSSVQDNPNGIVSHPFTHLNLLAKTCTEETLNDNDCQHQADQEIDEEYSTTSAKAHNSGSTSACLEDSTTVLDNIGISDKW